ncbi:disabled homolog 2-like [Pocillopora damicornis]|uniref:disabled homolog 2-like n=1 Tax=Pocillopora damicornis TaxID=46731 RepID=UPI000F556FFE|nr:disabled homolog 2-like [Pocillopora damicornis]
MTYFSSFIVIKEMETSGEGTKFQCKLVGTTGVPSPEGVDMCAEAFRKLKAQAKKKWPHKERVTLTISLEGIKIEDETSQKVQHMHPVKRISFVTPDPDDEKIFGYVCSQPDSSTGYTFYALKSGNAQIIIDAIVELFEVSVNLKQRAGSAKKQVLSNSSNATECRTINRFF